MAALEREGLLPGGPPPAPRNGGGRSWRRLVVGVAAGSMLLAVVYFAASSRAVKGGGRAALVEDIAEGLPDKNDPSEQAAMIMGSVNGGGEPNREAIPLPRKKSSRLRKLHPQLSTLRHLPPPRTEPRQASCTTWGKTGGRYQSTSPTSPNELLSNLPQLLHDIGIRGFHPPWSRVEGKSEVNLPQMPPLRGGICMGVD